MVPALAFVATAVSTLFAQATLARFTRLRRPHELAWTIALAMFALASAALSVGVTTGWDNGTFRIFYLFGAVLNVPWLALGTVYLLAGTVAGRRAQWGLVLFSGLAAGVVLTAPLAPIAPVGTIPVGHDVFGAFPRILAGVGSGLGATIIFGGALASAWRLARRHEPGSGRLAAANGLIALGTLVLASGGLVQGIVGHDEAFALSLATGISIIYAGFLVSVARTPSRRAAQDSSSSRRSSLPRRLRGSASTTRTEAGTL